MLNRSKDKRLFTIYDLVDYDVVADIGTDHGKLVGQLFLDNKISKAYLTDISEKSLSKARVLIQTLKVCDKCVFAVCDGLKGLQGVKKPYQVVIAGMGGEEIIKILSNCKNKNNIVSYILQPQKNVYNLRKYLVDNDYFIEKDGVVKEGKQFYFVIKAKQGKDNLSQQQLYFGKYASEYNSQDYIAYLQRELELFEEINKNANNLSKEKKEYFDMLKNHYEDILKGSNK